VQTGTLEGKACPCGRGLVCDTTTNTCVRALSGDAGTDAIANTSCLATAPGAPLYMTEFNDFSGWMVGAGTWGAQGGEAVQSDDTSNFAYAYNPAVTASDYRVVSSFRALAGMGTSTAVELAARVQLDGSGGQYHCNWDAVHGGFTMMYSTSPTVNDFFAQVYIDTSMIPNYDPSGSFVMEFQVRGSRLDCCVHGIAAAVGTATDTRFTAGAPGMKTFLASGAYDYLHVYAVP
jgi:hypothetical protein